MREELDREFQDKYKTDKQVDIQAILDTKKEIALDLHADTPEDWVSMTITINIPEFHVKLYRESSTLKEPDPLLEIVMLDLFCQVKMGADF